MADVIGPISSMPGAVHSAPAGAVCDDHPDRPAYRRVQGETDSMGCEMHDLCEACYTEHMVACAQTDTSGICDWCKLRAPKLRKRRDYDEGSCGPVYEVCDACVKADNERIQEYLDDDNW